MVGSRDLDRAPAGQVQREWLERSHVAPLLDVLHLHGHVLPFRRGLCNEREEEANLQMKPWNNSFAP